ncbi:hypothetical protein [Granulicella paludicola]|uniref:hypothetical protein n=1 Tax=Granulicella paludicola TaxID=474951 RepID=UPI0021E08CEF|nr:hypothetical protein [Granulicella paludicola]
MDNNTRTVEVAQLWERLEAMENDLRFDGKHYPRGMCRFPFRLAGQGFFPGGDGMWRDDGELASQKAGKIQQGGVLFLGNDFGVLDSYKKLEKKGFENVPTWRHIKLRAASAGIPSELTFFTNAIMGLRIDGKALSPRSWQTMAGVPKFCEEFLDFQLTTVKPRLTVVMGPHAKDAFDALATKSKAGKVLYTTHPYADFNFPPARRAADIAELKASWQLVS